MDEALALIDERGLEAMTLREIARRIGVSHAAPYRHFADRRALLTALSAEGSALLAERINAALDAAGGDLRARFLAAGFAYVRFALDHPALFQVMFSAELDAEDPALLAAKQGTFGILLRFIAEAQRQGAFPPGDVEALAIPIWAMHHGLATLAATRAFEGCGAAGLRRIVDDAHERLLDGLLRGARPAAEQGPAAVDEEQPRGPASSKTPPALPACSQPQDPREGDLEPANALSLLRVIRREP